MIIFIIILAAPAVLAQDNATPLGEKQLTLQQAYQLATENSRTLKQAKLAADRAEEVKKFRMDYVTYTPSGPTPSGAAATFTAATMADIGYQMAVKSKAVEEDKLYLSVVEKYNNLLAAQQKLALSQQTYSNAQMQNKINQLSLALGMTSNIQFNIGYTGFETAKVEVQNAQTGLDKAYNEFNDLLGLNLKERPILLDKPVFEPMQVDNLEGVITRTLDNDPTVWMKEQSTHLEKLQLDLYNYMDPTRDPYEAEKIDVKKAELSEADTKNQINQLMHTMHNSMLQLEEAYLMKQKAAQIAEQSLTIKKLMYDVGMVSELDLNTAELDAAKANQELNNTVYQYESLKLAFQKPWAYVANMGSRKDNGS